MAEDMRVGAQLREKVVELLLRAEHLTVLEPAAHLTFFAALCQMSGQSCMALAEGHHPQAVRLTRLMAATMWCALPEGPEQDSVREVLEELVTLLEHPEADALH